MATAAQTYTRSFRVRAYECDLLGHLNNAVYHHFVEETSGEAWGAANDGPDWYRSRDEAWAIQQVSIGYLHPAVAGDTLDVVTWVSEWGECHARREYEIRRWPHREEIARASARWLHVDRVTGQPSPVPPELVAALGADGRVALEPHRLPAQGLAAASYRWRHQVKRYELDSTGRVNGAIYLSWIEEAKFRAAEEAGWPLERMRAERFLTVQVRHDTEYLRPALYGDEVEVVSRLHDLRHVRGTWLHEVYRVGSGELLARDYSTGAFLDPEGRLVRAPRAMLKAVLRGPANLASPSA